MEKKYTYYYQSKPKNRWKRNLLIGAIAAILGISLYKTNNSVNTESRPIEHDPRHSLIAIENQESKPSKNNDIKFKIVENIERQEKSSRLEGILGITDQDFLEEQKAFLEKETNPKSWKNKKKNYERVLSELTRFDDTYKIEALKHNLENNMLKAISARESRGNLRVKSKKGAAGLNGIMPIMGIIYGLTIDRFIDQRTDDRYAIPTEARMITALLTHYKNPILAIASFNWRQPKLDAAIKKYGSDWKNIKNHLPRETRTYILNVVSYYHMLTNPEKYALQIKKLPLFNEERKNSIVHEIKKGENLYAIARQYGLRHETIMEKNPSLKDASVIPIGYRIFIPRKSL